MSNPYTQPSITGYNSSPPANDGTESSANQLNWDTHLNKIGGPIKTFAEAIDAAVLAAFGLEFGAAVLTKSTAYTVATADRGRFISVTGTTTITLPVAATAGAGFPVLIVNTGTNVVTVDGDSSETINGNTTVTLFSGEWIVLTSDGANWSGAGNFSITGSFTPTFSGFSSDPVTPVCTWVKRGNHVQLRFKFTNGTSDTTGFNITNLPAAITPAGTLYMPVSGLVDNNTAGWGLCSVSFTNILSFGFETSASGNFTNSGTKGFITNTHQISYYLDTE